MDTISFLSPMVKAIVDGRKTVTRRPLKTQPPDNFHHFGMIHNEVWFSSLTREQTNLACAGNYFSLECPYGKVGNILSIKEPWKIHKMNGGSGIYFEDGAFYIHSEVSKLSNGKDSQKWRSANTLPKWASRFQVKIKGIDVERLHDITDEGTKKEGMFLDYLQPSNLLRIDKLSRKDLFIVFWDLCYRESFPWESNPYVWVLDFELKSL